MFEFFKRKILLSLYHYCEGKLDLKQPETAISGSEIAQMFDDRMRQMEAEFDEKMIQIVEIMMESKLEVHDKLNEIIIANENWITNYYFRDAAGEEIK